MSSSIVRSALVLSVIAIAVGCSAQTEDDAESADSMVKVNADKRASAVAGAQVWSAEEFAKLPTKDVARGQDFANAPNPGDEIVCKFVEPTEEGEVGGKTAKFKCGPCELTPAEVQAGKAPCNVTKKLKVKYSGIGRPAAERNEATLARWRAEDAKANGEVFSEPVGTRLMWALGFYADGVYPVKVTCYGCPEKPFDAYTQFPNRAAGGARADRKFWFGAVEIKIDGEKLETTPDQGFDWAQDVPKIDAARGGSTKAEVDAWKLLAAFMFHGDNKAPNQRLFCPKDALATDGTCEKPRAMIQDIGASFGSEGAFFGLGYKKAELNAWKAEKVWKDLRACKANLTSQHQLKDPVVSDAGRAFLANLMSPENLPKEKVRAIFAASRIAERGEKIRDANGQERLVTADDWAAAFEEKRAEVAKPCR